MGDWTIVVSGSGSHHNGLAYDVDRLAQRFIDDLVENQHQVRVATATFGGLGALDTITPERERYQAQLEAAYRRDPTKFPYDDIAVKLAEYDEQRHVRLGHMAALNLLPGNLGKSYWDQQVARGEVRQWRYEPGHIRQVSTDGGQTWEPAPEPGDIITALFALQAIDDIENRNAANGDGLTDREVTLVYGNRRGVVSRLVDILGIREMWEQAQSDRDQRMAQAKALLRALAPARRPASLSDWLVSDLPWPTSAELSRGVVEYATETITSERQHGETRTRAHAAREEATAAPGLEPCGHCAPHFRGDHDVKTGRCTRRMGKVTKANPNPPQCPCTDFIPLYTGEKKAVEKG